jgi:glycosyltransferase involved in cell wall biosynthesis
VFPLSAHKAVRQIRARFQPTLYQHAPVPLNLPTHDETPLFSYTELPPVVSIVTPSFNQAQFLEQTIKSVLGQNYPKLEYLIMDGSSTDDTHRILAKYRSQLTFIESHKDSGQANALNRGFRQTSGEIMAWLNSDDLLFPGTIHQVVKCFLEHPEVDVMYGDRISIDENDCEVGRWILPPHDDTILLWANYVPQETLFWRRRIWGKTVGYVDESYQFAMDWELLVRFQLAGANFFHLPRFLGAFRIYPEQKTSKLEKIGKQEAERLHTLYHGRAVTWLEVRYNVRHYLARCMWRYLVYYLKKQR